MSESRKKLDVKVLLSALFISAVIFIAGISIGYAMNRERLYTIENEMKDVVRDVENFQLQFLFFDILGENATCPLLSDTLSNINDESYEIGSKLTSYGREEEIQDYNEYLGLKNEYSRLLVGYWLLAKKLKDSCKLNASTIVYFYTKECESCDNQGFVLTYLKQKYGEGLLVFALDADLGEPSIEVLKKYYKIEEYPSLIIDGELFEGFHPKEELEEVISG
jgi:thiol-disulfide isomerase/thioredoxin